MIASWQKRRSDFNHDWLKNRYLPALAKWINILDESVEDPVFEKGFLTSVLPQWAKYGPEARPLAECFDIEMSPSILASSAPLVRHTESSRQWLSTLVHALWLSRYPIMRWKSDVIACVNSTDEAYGQLLELIQAQPNPSTFELRSWRLEFEEFQTRCLALAKCMEVIPSRVLVT
jgi:hypothetical protein